MFPAEYASRKEDLRIFAEGLEEFYRGRFDKAESIFSGLGDRDRAALAYAGKCRSLDRTAAGGVERRMGRHVQMRF